MLAPLSHPALNLPGLRHAFFTRQGGVSTGPYTSLNAGMGSKDAPENVAKNLDLIAAHFNAAPEKLIFCYQIHSSIVHDVATPWPRADRPQGDALVTTQRGIILGALSADCAPVLFYDAKRGIIAAAHAGWKGALGGVLEATLRTMQLKGALLDDITAVIGPCIQQKSYEVGPEFPAAFLAENPASQRFFTPAAKPNHFMFDLPGYALARLQRAGITRAHSLGADTFADAETFHSYRRATVNKEPGNGTLLSAIMLA